MNKKRALIITYYWPPAGGPGVQRWLQFVKYLGDFDIEPIVYVPENPEYPIVDSSFLSEVPDEIASMKMGVEEKDYTRTYTASHKIKPSLDLLGMDIAYDENLQIMSWAKSQGKRKEIIEVFKSLKDRVDLSVKEIKKDFKISN